MMFVRLISLLPFVNLLQLKGALNSDGGKQVFSGLLIRIVPTGWLSVALFVTVAMTLFSDRLNVILNRLLRWIPFVTRNGTALCDWLTLRVVQVVVLPVTT